MGSTREGRPDADNAALASAAFASASSHMQLGSVHSRIAGTGSYLPDKIVTNADLESLVDTTSAWIFERTGIERRHVVAPEQTTLDMVEQAARRALEASNVAA